MARTLRSPVPPEPEVACQEDVATSPETLQLYARLGHHSVIRMLVPDFDGTYKIDASFGSRLTFFFCFLDLQIMSDIIEIALPDSASTKTQD